MRWISTTYGTTVEEILPQIQQTAQFFLLFLYTGQDYWVDIPLYVCTYVRVRAIKPHAALIVAGCRDCIAALISQLQQQQQQPSKQTMHRLWKEPWLRKRGEVSSFSSTTLYVPLSSMISVKSSGRKYLIFLPVRDRILFGRRFSPDRLSELAGLGRKARED